MDAQTQIIAHRGFWQTKPSTVENSLQALENAQHLNIYGTEFDVRMSKDGVLIIYHDEYHGSMEVSETNYKDLQTKKQPPNESCLLYLRLKFLLDNSVKHPFDHHFF